MVGHFTALLRIAVGGMFQNMTVDGYLMLVSLCNHGLSIDDWLDGQCLFKSLLLLL